jgi:tRNA(Ile)-lysidine synthase
MALLRLVAGWAERHAHPPIHAATVDHGLRPDSRAEAETVALWAGAIGIPHAVLTWTGEKPVTRVQERARAARYALLARHAQSLGADVLMTAHHADDQAETILFRLVRGSNIAGLAGMAERTRRGALIHARPLIGRSKAELVAFCDTIGQAYFSDPSNEDPRYARTSMRRLSALLAEHGLGRSALLRLAGRSARAEAALAAATDAARAGLAAAPSETLFAVRGDELVGLADEIVLRLLIGEIARIGRRRTAPRLERAEALVSRLLPALRRGGTFAATLGGTRIRLAGGRLTIEAEKARRGAAQARLQQSPTSAERKCEPCCHEDRRFPWQGTPLGLN